MGGGMTHLMGFAMALMIFCDINLDLLFLEVDALMKDMIV